MNVTDVNNQGKFNNAIYAKKNFDTTVLLISKKMTGSETYDALFSIPEFIDVYEHSLYYVGDANNFLKNNRFSVEEKRIAICSMQRLDLDMYLQFCTSLKELYNQKAIDEGLLDWAINPNFSTRKLLVKNFRNKQVINLLTILKNDKTISNHFKKAIDNILSGKLLEVLEDSGELSFARRQRKHFLINKVPSVAVCDATQAPSIFPQPVT